MITLNFITNQFPYSNFFSTINKKIVFIAITAIATFSATYAIYRYLKDDSKKIIFLTCNPGPAAHFAALGKHLSADKNYEVSYMVAGAACGIFDALEKKEKFENFNKNNIDLTSVENQKELAVQLAKKCSNAQVLIVDVGHSLYLHLKEALANEQVKSENKTLFASYYDNLEKWVPGGYSDTAAKVAKISDALFFANSNLNFSNLPYEKENLEMNLEMKTKIFSIGYFSFEKVAQLRGDRLLKHVRVDLRKSLFEKLNLVDKEEKIIVYLGENNTEYFEQSLPKFIEYLSQIESLDTIVLFQQHPNAKSKGMEEKFLNEIVFNPKSPRCFLSHLKTDDALVIADLVAGRQTSLDNLVVLAGIPYFQVGHKIYSNLLVRNQLCPVANDSASLKEIFSSISKIEAKSASLLNAIGYQKNCLNHFKESMQFLISQSKISSLAAVNIKNKS